MNTDSPEFDVEYSRACPTAKRKLWAAILIVVGVILVGTWLFAKLLSARTAARMSVSRNNLRQFGLAVHNYHDQNHGFPAAWIEDENGNGSFSWMYSILPLVGAKEVFQNIDSNYPWNDPRNMPHSRMQIEKYINVEIPDKADADGFAYSHYAGSSHLFQPNKFLNFHKIDDGTGTTLCVGEINQGFQPWAKPGHTRDPALGFNKGPDTFGSPFEGGVHFMFADGRVMFLSNNIETDALRALSTPNGGEKILTERLNRQTPND